MITQTVSRLRPPAFRQERWRTAQAACAACRKSRASTDQDLLHHRGLLAAVPLGAVVELRGYFPPAQRVQPLAETGLVLLRAQRIEAPPCPQRGNGRGRAGRAGHRRSRSPPSAQTRPTGRWCRHLRDQSSFSNDGLGAMMGVRSSLIFSHVGASTDMSFRSIAIRFCCAASFRAPRMSTTFTFPYFSSCS